MSLEGEEVLGHVPLGGQLVSLVLDDSIDEEERRRWGMKSVTGLSRMGDVMAQSPPVMSRVAPVMYDASADAR